VVQVLSSRGGSDENSAGNLSPARGLSARL